MIADIYVETSLNWNQKGNGIVGIAVALEDCDARTFYGFVKNCSQSKAIIIGITRALERIVRVDHVRLHLSNYFVGNALKNGWLSSWEARCYKSQGRTIKHAREWHELNEKLKGKRIEIHLNEFNGYRNYLIFESKERMKKHG